MPQIAANGILILIPSAWFLASKARATEFDTTFYAVQTARADCGCRKPHPARPHRLELSEAGKPFELYSRARLKRVK